MHKRWIWLFLFLPFILFAKPLEVLYIWHTTPTQPFTQITDNFAHSVAKDLNINLRSVFAKKEKASAYGNLNRFSYENFAKEYFFDSSYKPDVIIAVLFRKTGRNILEFSHNSRIPLFIVNTNISQEDKDFIQSPREVFPNFLGLVASNEVQAGGLLLQTLLDEAIRRKPNKTIEVLSIAGPREAVEAINRNEGLMQVLNKSDNVHMHQMVYANWDENQAYELTKKMLRRYKNDIDVIWAASDSMAIGASKAVKEAGLDIVIGGIDWSEQGLQALKDNTIFASVGGHFLNGGIALIALYDYFHGIDFKEHLGTQLMPNMYALTASNIHEYESYFSQEHWERLDFTHCSKVLNSELQSYDFSVHHLLGRSNE